MTQWAWTGGYSLKMKEGVQNKIRGKFKIGMENRWEMRLKKCLNRITDKKSIYVISNQVNYAKNNYQQGSSRTKQKTFPKTMARLSSLTLSRTSKNTPILVSSRAYHLPSLNGNWFKNASQ